MVFDPDVGVRNSPQCRAQGVEHCRPELPEWLDYLHIRNLRVGNSRVGLDFTRHGDRTFCNVVDVAGERLFVKVAFKK